MGSGRLHARRPLRPPIAAATGWKALDQTLILQVRPVRRFVDVRPTPVVRDRETLLAGSAWDDCVAWMTMANDVGCRCSD
jgi:hypothetical protein